MSKAIKFAWRYHRLDVEAYPSLREAFGAAWEASESGSESLAYIEHEGHTYTLQTPEYVAYEKEREARDRALCWPGGSRPTHRLRVRALTAEVTPEEWATAAWVSGEDDPAVAEWRELVGPERVMVEVVQVPVMP